MGTAFWILHLFYSSCLSAFFFFLEDIDKDHNRKLAWMCATCMAYSRIWKIADLSSLTCILNNTTMRQNPISQAINQECYKMKAKMVVKIRTILQSFHNIFASHCFSAASWSNLIPSECQELFLLYLFYAEKICGNNWLALVTFNHWRTSAIFWLDTWRCLGLTRPNSQRK